MTTTISVRELRPQLSRVIDKIHGRFDRYVITKRGKPEVVMLSIEDYEALLETLEITGDAALMKGIKKAERELKQGKGITMAQFKKDIGHA